METAQKGLCPKCSGNPSITIYPNIVHIKCKCGHEAAKKISDYLKDVKDVQCNSNIDTKEIEELQNKIMKAHNHICDHFSRVKCNTIERLRKEIENVQKAYEDSYNINSDILNLLNTIIVNYDGSEVMHENIIKNGDINIVEAEDKKYGYEYFQNYRVIKTKEITIKEFQKINTINVDITVTDLVLLKDGRIAACCQGKIKVFDPKNNYNLDIEAKVEWCTSDGLCQVDSGLIVTSGKGNIHLFSLTKDSAKSEFVIEEASCDINKILSLPNNQFASCSKDSTVKIWSADQPFTDIPIAVLDPETDNRANSVIYIKESNKIVVGMDEGMTIWSNETYELLKMIKGVKCNYRHPLVQIDEDRVMCGDCRIFYLVNITKGNVELTIEEEDLWHIYSMMYLKKDNLVIIGTNDGDFCVFDIETCDYKIIKGTHTSSITDMVLLDDGTFVSCSYDGLINFNKIVFK